MAFSLPNEESPTILIGAGPVLAISVSQTVSVTGFGEPIAA